MRNLDSQHHPVETVNWNDATDFCIQLSGTEQLRPFYFRSGDTITHLDGTGYRLPTEAEWEFACRAGTVTKYWIGNSEDEAIQIGWFKRNSGGRTHPVGELKPNPFGLFDIHGNVWEWVQDGWEPKFYEQFADAPAVNPLAGSVPGTHRGIRGGIWDNPPLTGRSAVRGSIPQMHRERYTGFRVALTVEAVRSGDAASTNQFALEFDGESDYIEVAEFPPHNGEVVTVEAWVKPAAAQDAANLVSWLGPQWITVFQSGDSWGVGKRLDDAGVVPGEWVHLAATFAGDQLALYVNGQLRMLRSENYPLAPTEQGLYLGGCPVEKLKHDGERWFRGEMRQARISSGVRYAGEFEPPQRLSPDDATLACYEFTNPAEETLTDSSEKNRHGKIIGAKWVEAP